MRATFVFRFLLRINKVENIKIILADPSFISRTGIKSTLEASPECKLILEVTSSFELLKETKKQKPNIVIIDYNVSDTFSINDLKKIKLISPKTNILVISSDNNRKNIYKVLNFGIKNFLTKECYSNDILDAVKATAKGEKFFSAKIIDIMLEKNKKDKTPPNK